MAIYENIELDKGLYSTGNGFTAELESIDSSENYKGTSLDGLDAFERQLKRFDITVSGPNSSTLDKFFKTYDSAVLFPEYVTRAVKKGKDEVDILPHIVATRTQISSLDYRTLAYFPTETEKELKNVAEGVAIPETTVNVQSNLVKLKKRGRMLVASYEALRFQRLDLFTVMLKQIGAYIATTQLNDAVTVITDGDGNSNPAKATTVAKVGEITYQDLINFWNRFDLYSLNTMIVSPNVVSKILVLPEMKNAVTGLNFYSTDNVITPFGTNLLKSSAIAPNKIIGLDKNYALEMVQAGGITTEYDRLIDRQFERASITEISGFAKIFTDASKILIV